MEAVAASEPAGAAPSDPPRPLSLPDDLKVPALHWAAAGVPAAAAGLAVLHLLPGGRFAGLVAERGVAAVAVLYLAGAVLAFAAMKGARLASAARRLREAEASPPLPEGASRAEAAALRDELARLGSAAALRRARALNAYATAGSRGAAVERADEDAAHAHAASEQGFALPRAALWSVPLVGVAATVTEVGTAMARLSVQVERAEGVEALRGGLGAAATSAGLALDTTLLALSLAVALLLALVLLERVEGGHLLALERDVGDAVLDRLPAARAAGPDEAAESLRAAAATVEAAGARLLRLQEEGAARIAAVGEAMLARVEAREARGARELESLAAAVQEAGLQTVGEVRDHAGRVATGLADHAREIAAALAAATGALEQRVAALREAGSGPGEEDRLGRALEALDASVRALHPALERLARPRRLLLVEGETALHGEDG